MLACYHGHSHVAQWLLTEAGCDARFERDKVSPLLLPLAICVPVDES
jgi:hypothetical protein